VANNTKLVIVVVIQVEIIDLLFCACSLAY